MTGHYPASHLVALSLRAGGDFGVLLACHPELCNSPRMAKQSPQLIGSREACELLNVNRSTLVRWIDADRLDYWLRLPNGSYLFDRAVIEAKKREREAAA